jgi:CMP-N-acetylneuraminic acid synthetase
MKILCIIPARSGSKGISNKNIKLFKNKPLIAWTIEQAQKCKYNMKIIVSTDSEIYKNIALKYCAEVPFLRPYNISQDLSTDYEFITHCTNWLKNNENYYPDIIVQLRPTQPCRKIETINECLDIFIKNYNEYDSLRSVVENEKSPYKMYTINNNNLIPLFKSVNNFNESFNQPRQILPLCYLHNGYIDILKASILKDNTISGNKIYPYIMNKNDIIDIDTIDDWKKAEENNIYKNIIIL